MTYIAAIALLVFLVFLFERRKELEMISEKVERINRIVTMTLAKDLNDTQRDLLNE